MTRALWFLCLMAAVAFVFAVFPEIDLKIAGLFYQNGHFPTQRAFLAEKFRTLGFVVPYMPVSYTHLDVYKRQQLHGSGTPARLG